MVHYAIVLAAAALATPQAGSGTIEPSSLQGAAERGKAMYLYDRAAWVTSDDAITRIPADRQAEVGGWIVTPSTIGLHVEYFGKGARADRVIYGADVVGGAVTNAIVYPLASEPLLKQPALQMTKALLAAKGELLRHADWHPCQSAPFNSIVLPPDERGTIPVYFLTPQTQAASFPFGGHYEVEVAADGKVTFSRAFTRSCVELTKPAPNSGATPAALFITHLLDSHPTEIHVFEQYYVGLPVFVGTGPKTVWKVQNGVIADVSASMSR